ncbi:MAG: crotonase/enoyl-CoA hydratase family protein [Syntrophales bacterium]|jgi:enoyl-CoA hydratase/carnithine racemase|nr:crotonase/enoyl-CoA hydratase family protein [Syntrophales bacterium]MDY0045562.1 crotonase/enoyl-CoA hydratase family protein [Syntrophales bacterium]
MTFKFITYQLQDNVATITLNRPDKLNAVNDGMLNELIEAFDQADKDDEVRAIIVTGAGRAFCAGADLADKENTFNYRTESLEDHRDSGGTVVLKIFELKKPVIAAINGPAVGFGITMTLPMDVRIAVENAKIAFPFTRRGIVPDACCAWFLPRIVGISRAVEWTMTGRTFSAEEAFKNGLLSMIAAPHEVMKKSMAVAREISDNTSAVSVALTRQLFWRTLGADHPMEVHRLDSKCIYYMGLSKDSSEGALSFLEKRPPHFTMKPGTDMPDFYPWWYDIPFKK